MAGYEDIYQRAADYQSLYAGNKFQCMKTKDLNDPRLGMVFNVARIEPQRTGQIAVILNDGTQMPVDAFNANFSMITEQTPAMPEGEVRAMHARLKQGSNSAPLDPSKQIVLPDELKEFKTQPVKNPNQHPVPGVNTDINGQSWSANTSGVGTSSSAATQQVTPENLAKDLFGMFTLTPTDLEFVIPVNLPTLDLIQMMYAQASDKEEFLSKFSTYVMQNIDLRSVKDAMSVLMVPKAKKIRAAKN